MVLDGVSMCGINYETITLRTNRLVLKKGEKEDFLKVYEYDFSKLKNIDNETILIKQDNSKIKKLFKNGNYYKKTKKAHMFDWIVYLNNEAIANVFTSENNDNMVELEFNMHPFYWKHGYMIESLVAAIEYLFSVGYENVVCTYLECNKNAKKLLGKLGFKPYTIIEDAFKSERGNLLDKYKVIINKEDWFSKTGKLIKVNGSL